MDEPWGYHAKGNKTDTEKQMHLFVEPPRKGQVHRSRMVSKFLLGEVEETYLQYNYS